MTVSAVNDSRPQYLGRPNQWCNSSAHRPMSAPVPVFVNQLPALLSAGKESRWMIAMA